RGWARWLQPWRHDYTILCKRRRGLPKRRWRPDRNFAEPDHTKLFHRIGGKQRSAIAIRWRVRRLGNPDRGVGILCGRSREEQGHRKRGRFHRTLRQLYGFIGLLGPHDNKKAP